MVMTLSNYTQLLHFMNNNILTRIRGSYLNIIWNSSVLWETNIFSFICYKLPLLSLLSSELASLPESTEVCFRTFRGAEPSPFPSPLPFCSHSGSSPVCSAAAADFAAAANFSWTPSWKIRRQNLCTKVLDYKFISK